MKVHREIPLARQARLRLYPEGMTVYPISSKEAAVLVVRHHYLHRKPPISYAYGLVVGEDLVGVVTFGTPASRHLQMGVCAAEPGIVLELNRLWTADKLPRNTESWFISRAIKMLPPRIIVSYADTARGHVGYVYRASNFHYAGWTDMDRKTPRFDYIPAAGGHTRDAFRKEGGYVARVRRKPKVKYWTVSGSPCERKHLRRKCQWPILSWQTVAPPIPDVAAPLSHPFSAAVPEDEAVA